MNDTDTIRVHRASDGAIVQALPDGSTKAIEGKTDWTRLDAMTEDEIETNALNDPDNPPLSDTELDAMHHVPNPRAIRERLHLSQEQFAKQFHIPVGTLRDWEQRKRIPDSAARALLKVIDHAPNVVVEALAS